MNNAFFGERKNADTQYARLIGGCRLENTVNRGSTVII